MIFESPESANQIGEKQQRTSRGVLVVPCLAICALLMCLCGCALFDAGQDPVGVSADPPDAAQDSSAEKSAESAASKPAKASDDADKKAKEKEKQEQEEEEASDGRKLAKMKRDLAVARRKVKRAIMARAHNDIAVGDAIATAEKELGLQQQRLANFTERAAPNRIEWARLGLVRAEDRAKEAEEELKQLEMMYAEDDFADGTKEIVLERGRRRLERSAKDLELRREDFAILTEKTIPLETAEHEQKNEQKAQAVKKAVRDGEGSRLDKEIAVMSAEAEVVRQEAELVALEEKIEKKRLEREKEQEEEAEGQQAKGPTETED